MTSIDLERTPGIAPRDNPTTSYWRLSIDPRSEFGYRQDLKNLLVDKLILALDEACEQDSARSGQKQSEYVDSDYSILGRIATFNLRKWGGKYPDQLSQAIHSYRASPTPAWQSEFHELLESQFPNLAVSTREEILSDIRRGPGKEFVDEVLTRYQDSYEGRDPGGEGRNGIPTLATSRTTSNRRVSRGARQKTI